MAKRSPKITTGTGIEAALEIIKQDVNRPFGVPTERRTIPTRHRGLGELLAGPNYAPGLPTGSFIEILGAEGSGKSTLTATLMEAVLSQPDDVLMVDDDKGRRAIPVPRKVVYLDFEQTVDLRYVKAIAPSARLYDPSSKASASDANAFILQPEIMEDGLQAGITLMKSGEVGMLAIDSVPAMLPREESEKHMRESTVGILPRQINKFFRMTAGTVRKYQIVVVFVNQWRDKIGVSFGDPRTSPGGKGLRYNDTIRIDVQGPKHTPWFEHGKVCRIKTMKNKVSGQLGMVEYHLETGKGISAEVELLQVCADNGLVQMTSANRPVVKMPGTKNERKYKNVREFLEALRSNRKLYDAMMTRAIAKCKDNRFLIDGGKINYTGGGLSE